MADSVSKYLTAGEQFEVMWRDVNPDTDPVRWETVLLFAREHEDPRGIKITNIEGPQSDEAQEDCYIGEGLRDRLKKNEKSCLILTVDGLDSEYHMHLISSLTLELTKLHEQGIDASRVLVYLPFHKDGKLKMRCIRSEHVVIQDLRKLGFWVAKGLQTSRQLGGYNQDEKPVTRVAEILLSARKVYEKLFYTSYSSRN